MSEISPARYRIPAEYRDFTKNALARLSASAFRARFRLSKKDADYARQKGSAAIASHARSFIAERLAPAYPKNDGKQTPMRGHPVFIAQHATATCCRSCLSKWHGVPKSMELTEQECDMCVALIMAWLAEQLK